MRTEVVTIAEVTEELLEAFARLIPQLSSAMTIPDAIRLRAVVSGGCSVLFAARCADRIVGVLTLAWYDAPSGRKAWIEDVVVDATARGSGAGDALVRTALAHAARIGAGRVSLTSNPSRIAARALYRKTGFEASETTVFVFKTDKS